MKIIIRFTVIQNFPIYFYSSSWQLLILYPYWKQSNCISYNMLRIQFSVLYMSLHQVFNYTNANRLERKVLTMNSFWTFKTSTTRFEFRIMLCRHRQMNFTFLPLFALPNNKINNIQQQYRMNIYCVDEMQKTWPVSMLLSTHAWLQFSIKMNPIYCPLFTFQQGKKWIKNTAILFKPRYYFFCCHCTI